MTFILLTGAGFSYNWGGPLASEVFSQLLADKDIDDLTREMLFNAPGGFEQVLADLQLSADPADKKRHATLITAVVGIFNGMNNTFMHMQFEFENPPSVQHSMASFLSRFHAIFTLNQDALLEQHYNPHIGPPMNWGHLQLPGMKFHAVLPTLRGSAGQICRHGAESTLHDVRKRCSALREAPRLSKLGANPTWASAFSSWAARRQ